MLSVPHSRSGGGALSGQCVGVAAQVEVADDREREHRALDRDQAQRAPPHQAAVAEAEGRQVAHVERVRTSRRRRRRSRFECAHAHGWLLQRERCAAVSARCGQNQTVSAIATGTAPQTTAHGVKIEPMNSTVVATRRQERPDRRAREQHRGGRAARRARVVTSTSRRSVGEAARRASARRPARSHSGSRPCTTGMRVEVVRRRRRRRRPFERAGAPRVGAGSAPCRAAAQHVDEEQQHADRDDAARRAWRAGSACPSPCSAG